MNRLLINVTIAKNPSRSFCEPIGIIAPSPRVEARIAFELYNPFNAMARRMTIVMEARHYDSDECLRDELKQSAYIDWEVWNMPTGDLDDSGEWTIEIIDPSGFLKWFGIDQAEDLFKKHQKHDKPLRLPASFTK